MDQPHTRFRIAGLGVGWMDWQVRGPGLSEDMPASWVGCPSLDLMLRMAITMLTYRKEGYYWHLNTKDWADFVVPFSGEPECYRLTFRKPQADAVPFILEKSDDDMGTLQHAPYCVIGQGTVSIGQFVDDLVVDCTSILKEWGLVGYHEMWQNDEFPVSLLLRLLAVRRGEEPFREGFAQELAALNQIGSGSQV